MSDDRTTVVVQRYLDALDGDAPAGPIVQALLDRAARRLKVLCDNILRRAYPRLARPPLNLETDELLGAVVERLLKALRDARPKTVREFFWLANQHLRWELNDLARRLDERPATVEFLDDLAPVAASSGSGLGPGARRILAAIDALPEDEREALTLVRVQGLTLAEAAGVVGASARTVQRRVTRAVLRLAEQLGGLPPAEGGAPGSPSEG